MRAIVTGGAGFIGSALIGALNGAGVYDITVVDNLSISEKWRNLIGKRYTRYINKSTFLRELEYGTWREKPSVIFHLGACSSTSETDAEYLFHNNVHYSQLLCQFAVKHKARFIYASSAATYGAGEHGYSDDTTKLNSLRPINRYGLSKQVFDQWLAQKRLLSKVVGLKFFNVYGPNEYHKGPMISMVQRAFEQISATGTVQLFKSSHPDYRDGEQRRDFIYVKDCVAVMMKLATSHRKVVGLYNLGTGSSRTWNDLAAAVFSAMKLPPKIEYIETPAHLAAGYQNYTQAEMKKLKNAIKGLSFASLEEGVADYVSGYLMQNYSTI